MIACLDAIVRSAGPIMRRLLGLFLVLVLLSGCNYGRMKDDEAVNTYGASIPEMPRKAIPVTGGIEVLRQADPGDLKNPIAGDAASVERGKEAYGYYCIQCHGPKLDGYGTVGQSFAPLPANLKTSYVQDQSDGDLFYKISLGFNRHPPLAATVAVEDRWAVINYMRSLATPSKG